jgi:hypothetical protein
VGDTAIQSAKDWRISKTLRDIHEALSKEILPPAIDSGIHESIKSALGAFHFNH